MLPAETNERHWVAKTAMEYENNPGADASSFTVASWNLQADRCKPGHDGSDRRGVEACLQQLLREKPDIIVLLEMQRCKRQLRQRDCRYCALGHCREAHAEWADAVLRQNGYDGDFHKARMVQTVGLYFREDTLSRAEGRMLFCNFDNQFGEQGGKCWRSNTNKGSVLAPLKHRATGLVLLAVATHLSVPKLPDGAWNTSKPLGELVQLRRKVEDVFVRNGGALPLIVAGDFNSVPSSGGEGYAPPHVYERLNEAGRLGWGLQSAYASVLGQEPVFTAWGPDFLGCIDYIFFSPDAFEPLEVLGVPSQPPQAQDAPPSDHLLMQTRLRFRRAIPEAKPAT